MNTRGFVFGAGLLCLGVYSWLAVGFQSAQFHPESKPTPTNGFQNATASALEGAADVHLRVGVAALNNTDLPPAERLATYREDLKIAEALLLRGRFHPR